MDALYGLERGHPARLDAPNHSISFDADTIAKALVNIYQKKYGNGSPDIEPTLFEKTKEILGGAVNKGWNAGGSPATDRNSAFIDALRHNTDVFSAFRTHKMQSKIAAQLLDSKGRLKPFGQFVKDVKPYVIELNRAQLQTEYDTAVLRAHQAADWKQFEAEKDVLPNLEWKPSTSPNPGEDHKPYWGTILPIDHEFWNQHRPGDRWNCKCSLRNTDKPATSVPAETVVSAQPQKGLDTNPGTTGEIFSSSHPYFPENCGVCPFNKGVGKLFAALVEKKGNCNACDKPPVSEEKSVSIAQYINKGDKEWDRRSAKSNVVKNVIKSKLPQVPKGKGFKYEKKVTVDNHTITITKNFAGESINKCFGFPEFDATAEILQEFDKWILSGKKDDDQEAGEDHPYPFNVYRTTYKGHKIVFKTMDKGFEEVLWIVTVDYNKKKD